MNLNGLDRRFYLGDICRKNRIKNTESLNIKKEMKKVLFVLLSAFLFSVETYAQIGTNENEVKKEIQRVLDTRGGSPGDIIEIYQDSYIEVELFGDTYCYTLKRKGTDNHIRVYSNGRVFSLASNIRISLPQEYCLFAIGVSGGEEYYVSKNNQRAIVDSDIAAEIVAKNLRMEENFSTKVNRPKIEDKPTIAERPIIINKAEKSITKIPETDSDILSYQKSLLNQKKYASAVMIGGATVAGIGTGMFITLLNNNIPIQVMEVGQWLIWGGVTVGSLGAAWFIINQFQWCNSQIKLNKALSLRFGPEGISLQF